MQKVKQISTDIILCSICVVGPLMREDGGSDYIVSAIHKGKVGGVRGCQRSSDPNKPVASIKTNLRDKTIIEWIYGIVPDVEIVLRKCEDVGGISMADSSNHVPGLRNPTVCCPSACGSHCNDCWGYATLGKGTFEWKRCFQHR